jgi:hypothetical protein
MNRGRARKDAEAFADALEGRGQRNSDVQELVRFAGNLREAAIEPSPAFVRSLRSELMADASSVLVVAPKPIRTAPARPVAHPVRRRLAAATAAVLATAGMLGIVTASAQALPGEMLYPVKRTVESAQLALHRSDAGRGEFQLAQAAERLAEAESLADKDDARSDERVVESLNDFADQASAGSKSLFSDYTDAGNEKSINKVNSFATESSNTLAALSGKLSPDAESAFKEAASTITDLAAQAKSLCAECQAAELRSLADTVSAILRAEGDVASGTDNKAPSVGTATSAPGGIDGQPPTFPGAAPPVPTPQELSNVTEPIVGALLGDDDQVGLVPGLVDGPGDSK